MPLETTKS